MRRRTVTAVSPTQVFNFGTRVALATTFAAGGRYGDATDLMRPGYAVIERRRDLDDRGKYEQYARAAAAVSQPNHVDGTWNLAQILLGLSWRVI